MCVILEEIDLQMYVLSNQGKAVFYDKIFVASNY